MKTLITLLILLISSCELVTGTTYQDRVNVPHIVTITADLVGKDLPPYKLIVNYTVDSLESYYAEVYSDKPSITYKYTTKGHIKSFVVDSAVVINQTTLLKDTKWSLRVTNTAQPVPTRVIVNQFKADVVSMWYHSDGRF